MAERASVKKLLVLEGPVGQPGDVRRSIKVVRPASGHAALAHHLHEVPVVREDANDVLVVVDDPDVPLGIVGTLVTTLEAIRAPT